jgi:hypothetical protein
LRWKLKKANELKNLNYEDSVLLVSELLNSESRVTRTHAAMTLNILQDSKAVPPLIEFINKQLQVKRTQYSGFEDLESGIEALASLRDRRAIQPLVLALEDNLICRSAASALKNFLDSELIEKLKITIFNWSNKGLINEKLIGYLLEIIFDFGDNSLMEVLINVFSIRVKNKFRKHEDSYALLRIVSKYGDERIVESVSKLLFEELKDNERELIYQLLYKYPNIDYKRPLNRSDEIKFLLKLAHNEINRNIHHPDGDILIRVCINAARLIDFRSFQNSIWSWGYGNMKDFYHLIFWIPVASLVEVNDRLLLLRCVILGRLFDDYEISGIARTSWKILQPSDSEKTIILSDENIISTASHLFSVLYNQLLSSDWGKMPSANQESLINELCSWSFDKSLQLSNLLKKLRSQCYSASNHLVYGYLPYVLRLYNEGKDFEVEYKPSTSWRAYHNESNSDDDVWFGDKESLRVIPK